MVPFNRVVIRRVVIVLALLVTGGFQNFIEKVSGVINLRDEVTCRLIVRYLKLIL
jgi:hypothetical protein